MPIFDYACNKCNACWEVFAGLDGDGEPEKCPDCGSANIEKQISFPSPPIFHGSGFHETDYKRKPR